MVFSPARARWTPAPRAAGAHRFLADDREVLNRRLDALESRFRNEFNALDSLLAQIQSTGTFLTEQLAGIPLPGDNNR